MSGSGFNNAEQLAFARSLQASFNNKSHQEKPPKKQQTSWRDNRKPEPPAASSGSDAPPPSRRIYGKENVFFQSGNANCGNSIIGSKGMDFLSRHDATKAAVSDAAGTVDTSAGQTLVAKTSTPAAAIPLDQALSEFHNDGNSSDGNILDSFLSLLKEAKSGKNTTSAVDDIGSNASMIPSTPSHLPSQRSADVLAVGAAQSNVPPASANMVLKSVSADLVQGNISNQESTPTSKLPVPFSTNTIDGSVERVALDAEHRDLKTESRSFHEAKASTLRPQASHFTPQHINDALPANVGDGDRSEVPPETPLTSPESEMFLRTRSRYAVSRPPRTVHTDEAERLTKSMKQKINKMLSETATEPKTHEASPVTGNPARVKTKGLAQSMWA